VNAVEICEPFPEWAWPHPSPFDLVKIEGLDVGSGSRDLVHGRQAMGFPFGQGWPAANLRYLAAVFNGGCPWQYEQQLTQNAGYPTVVFWAWDHVQLFGWDVRKRAVPGVQVF
jgi:hypothetical protein